MATLTAPAAARRRATVSGLVAHLDVLVLALPVAISAFGLLMIYDASRMETARGGLPRFYYVERQGIAIVIGLLAMLLVMAVDYRRIRDAWPLVYAAVLPLLAGVLVLGRNHKGAQAWFQVGPFQFQPSEVAKVALVVAIAGYCHQHRGELDAWRLAVALALAGGVMAIVYAQHDLGTMLVIMVCAAAVLVIAGLRPVHILVLLLLGATLVGAAVVTGQVQAYRLDRLTTFADQSAANHIATVHQTPTQYNLKASKTAIASGGFTGAGFGRGLQTRNGFVPEQHTDFIFTAVGEDLGFVGGATLLLLYGILVWRLWRIALLSSDFFGTLLAIGVLAMFTIQVFENVGMTMGIMPITGIPLPFMSYGGSAVIASFVAVGLVLNVHMRRFT
ncbi:MAG TPA: FtsW/RodA/SpoVE family cell cycle protein [Acidimicrobiia bacterium]|nr:FtsW/RodA/SpoVE family cell cycle protein [Acidimicrobiia bacterium]